MTEPPTGPAARYVTIWTCPENECDYGLEVVEDDARRPESDARYVSIHARIHYGEEHPGIAAPADLLGRTERYPFHVGASPEVDPQGWVNPNDSDALIVTDVARMAAAGAGLLHALYHAGAETFGKLPDPVIRAYMRASKVYGVGR